MAGRIARKARSWRVALLAAVVGIAVVAAGCPGPEEEAAPEDTPVPEATPEVEAAAYEIWAIDQGTHTIHIYDQDLEEIDVVELEAVLELPHMIDFTSDYEHAFVANPASGDVAWIRTEDREVLHVIETGAGSHMAVVTPDDQRVIVDVIGDAQIVEILIDPEEETYELGRTLVVAEDPRIAERADEFPGTSPVCHDYTADGRYAYVTLGPALDEGGVVVLDTESFELVAAYSPDEVRANCGTLLSPDGTKMYVNGGSPEGGWWSVFDTATHELIGEESSRGNDAHGVWLTPDNSELWMVNRESSNGIVIDPETDEIIEEIEFVGTSPDIIAMSPDATRAYITLRGPVPQTGPHAIAGETPGFSVIDIETREILEIVEPAEGDARSDFHGIGVRPLG